MGWRRMVASFFFLLAALVTVEGGDGAIADDPEYGGGSSVRALGWDVHLFSALHAQGVEAGCAVCGEPDPEENEEQEEENEAQRRPNCSATDQKRCGGSCIPRAAECCGSDGSYCPEGQTCRDGSCYDESSESEVGSGNRVRWEGTDPSSSDSDEESSSPDQSAETYSDDTGTSSNPNTNSPGTADDSPGSSGSFEDHEALEGDTRESNADQSSSSDADDLQPPREQREREMNEQEMREREMRRRQQGTERAAADAAVATAAFVGTTLTAEVPDGTRIGEMIAGLGGGVSTFQNGLIGEQSGLALVNRLRIEIPYWFGFTSGGLPLGAEIDVTADITHFLGASSDASEYSSLTHNVYRVNPAFRLWFAYVAVGMAADVRYHAIKIEHDGAPPDKPHVETLAVGPELVVGTDPAETELRVRASGRYYPAFAPSDAFSVSASVGYNMFIVGGSYLTYLRSSRASLRGGSQAFGFIGMRMPQSK